jgi:hypothetical protein
MEKKEEDNKNPTLFYKVFENTLNSVKSNLFPHSQSSNHVPKNPSSKMNTPLENILKTNKSKQLLKEQKKELLKGTKMYYMIERIEEEEIYIYI